MAVFTDWEFDVYSVYIKYNVIFFDDKEIINMVEKINELIGKKTVKNGVWLYLLQIFNTVIPLLTLPYITRILGSSQYGIFSIAVNIIGYYQVVVEYGFAMSATRKVAVSDHNKVEMDKTFSCVLWARVILLALCVVITGMYIFLNLAQLSQCVCLVILMITVLGNCVQLNWLFQGMENTKYISLTNIIARMISVVLVLLFVKKTSDLYLYCLLYSVSPFFSGCLGLLFAHKEYDIRLIHVSFSDVWSELKEGWYVFTTQLSSKVFGAIGITFLGIFASHSEVGIYSAIQKIPNILMLVWSPVSQVLYPISSKKMKESEKMGAQFVSKCKKIFLPLFALVAVVCALISKPMLEIAFGQEYAVKAYWIIPLLAWVVVGIYNNFSGIQTLLAGGYDKEYSNCFQIGVVFTILSNLILIYLFKGDGACIAPLLSECVLGFLLSKEVNKIRKR